MTYNSFIQFSDCTHYNIELKLYYKNNNFFAKIQKKNNTSVFTIYRINFKVLIQ